MSSSESRLDSFARGARASAAVLLLVVVAGCTVRPLYSNMAPSATSDDPAVNGRVASIGVAAPDTRYEQEVRNHLIFLLNGGRGEPANPAYTLDLAVTSIVTSSAASQLRLGAADERQPSAEVVILTSNFTLRETAKSLVVATGKRQITSSYDRPRQEFAALRARRDAENRAARELAELVRLAVLQKLEDVPVE